jgi:hypothetical protein
MFKSHSVLNTRVSGSAFLASLWVLISLLAASAYAQPGNGQVRTSDMLPVYPAEFVGDVRDQHRPHIHVPRYLHTWNDFDEPEGVQPSGASMPDSLGAPQVAFAPMPAPSANFAGLGFDENVTDGTPGGTTAGAGWPPDTNGDVGETVYIQAVNDAFAIYNKSTGVRLAAFTEDWLWSGASTGTPCDSNNQGDPVVLYDAVAHRWILTNFAFAVDASFNPIKPFYQCFAVSKSNDPVAGGWWLYAVKMDTGVAGQPPDNTFNDYGKFGLWNDGCLYGGFNGFNNATGNYAGPIFASFNTANMYAGAALTGSIGFISSGTLFSMFPANLLGTSIGSMPPVGTPAYFVNESLVALRFEVRKFTPGANCGGGGTLGTATNVSQTSYIRPGQNIVPQPNTTSTLDSLGDRLMQKVQYRKIGAAESLWVVHSTRASSSSTVRPQWAQIDVSGGVVATSPLQQQIFAPDTTLYRWMPSLAVDGQGNMAMGYSRSNGTSPNFPGLYYAGRLAGDPANTLPQTETVLQAGSGSQINGPGSLSGTAIHRWGDYSAMSVDPSDDCTFWYTNLYYDSQTNGNSSNWRTRIGSFKFPGCVTIGPATKLVFGQQPTNTAAGASITPAVTVQVQDASGNVVTSSTASITVAIGTNPGSSTLSGSATVNAVNGVATFSNLSLNKTGTGYTLTAASTGLTGATSGTFNITAGTASKLVFGQQPTNTAAGASITPAVTVQVQDASGNVVTGSTASITIAIGTNPGGSTLGGTATVNAVNGVATFSNLSLNKVGTGYTLTAASTGLTGATSGTFNITAGTASKLVFGQQPTNTAAGASITPAVTVQVQDANGNVVTGSTASITLAIGTNPGSSTLSGTATVNAVNGVATFSNLSLNKPGTGYTLTAASTGLTGATSSTFNIAVGPAANIAFTQQPSDALAGMANNPAIVATVTDIAGNPVAGESVSLTVASGPAAAFTAITNPQTTDASGKATFADAVLTVAGTYTLGAADGALNATSNSFKVLAASPDHLAFTPVPGDIVQGQSLGTVTVTEYDAFNNQVVADNTTLVSLTAGSCGGTVLGGTQALNGGAVSFATTQSFMTAASGVSLSATPGASPPTAASSTFNVASNTDFVFSDGFDGCRP